MHQKGNYKQTDSSHSKVGISTSILSIHTFLVKFFNHYIEHNREEFINLINMPFGHSIPSRLRHLHGHPLPDEEE